MNDYAQGIRMLLKGEAPDGTPVATYREDVQGFGAKTDSFYDPCVTGLHLCGFTGDNDQPTTFGNWPLSKLDAEEAFTWVKDRIQIVDQEQADFILELNIQHNTVDDLRCNRQQLVSLLDQCESGQEVEA
jgi:hypothetical protein